MGNFKCAGSSCLLDLDCWQCTLLLEHLVHGPPTFSELVWYDTSDLVLGVR